ncbi:hypothetical protein [Arthrobacter koreensis]|uniref:hypothetical protein n=1 Tax=Arthrobacter koreensis TaxID=199136 RepID=UPI003809A83B
MEFRSSLTLKPFDVITLPGIGTKTVGSITQTGHDRYQLRLDEKFVESVTIDVRISNGEQRSPERHEGPWAPRPGTP